MLVKVITILALLRMLSVNDVSDSFCNTFSLFSILRQIIGRLFFGGF